MIWEFDILTELTVRIEAPKNVRLVMKKKQYVNPNGQTWTTLEDMIKDGTNQKITKHEDQLGIIHVV